MGFLTFTPTSGDTDNVLLQKIVQILAAGGGALTMGFLKVLPTSGDTDNVLLQKIVQILAGPAGSGGGVFIASIGGSGTNITLAGTTIFSGCIGSHISFCPTNTWDVGTALALPRSVDAATSYKLNGVNVIIGNAALFNYFFGGAGNAAVTGNFNTGGGFQSLRDLTTGVQNSGHGYQALRDTTTGSRNMALGYRALRGNTTGSDNVAIGFQALNLAVSTSDNLAIGTQALLSATGNRNVAIGHQALSLDTTGEQNTAVGRGALSTLNIVVAGTGNNTAIGFGAGAGLVTGINNTIIGANVSGLAAALSNNIIIADGAGNQRITADNTGAVTIPISLRINGPLIIPAIANARAGNAVLVAGTVTVANTSVTANTIVMLTRKTIGGVVGNTSYTVAAGASFTINSSVGTDTSTMSYFLIENP